MKFLINSLHFYFLFPLYFPLILILFFFNIPNEFYLSLFSLFFITTPILILINYFYPIKFEIDKKYNQIFFSKRNKVLALLLCITILICGPLDIFTNGFKLLDPLSYAEFHGYGRYIRHITILCWTLIPISYIYIKNTKIKFILISYAIIFPILILDRNRLFNSFYAIIFCKVLAPQIPKINQSIKRPNIIGISSAAILVFSVLGLFRSGDSFIVESSGHLFQPDSYPLRKIFYSFPSIIQQVLLYLTTPIFNFSTIVFENFTNKDFLMSQLSPFSRDLYDAYPSAPILVQRFNVGTEFYPWLLYGGLPLVAFSFAVMLISFLWSVRLLKKYPNIFTLLIFLKISYTVLFMGFAPQFYILFNLSFVILMIILWVMSSILNLIQEKIYYKRQSNHILSRFREGG